MNRPAIDTPATEPSTISTMLGGTVSAMAAPVASSAIISFGWWPRRFISGKQRRRDGRHVGHLGAGDARDEEQRAEQHIGHAGPHVAEQRREEVDDGLAHAGGVEHAAEQHEDRHRQQDDARHALVHAADHHEDRHMGGEGEEAHRADAEAERDRHTDDEADDDEADEEDQDVDVAEARQRRRQQPERAGGRGDQGDAEHQIPQVDVRIA